jgi:hypothetical protein
MCGGHSGRILERAIREERGTGDIANALSPAAQISNPLAMMRGGHRGLGPFLPQGPGPFIALFLTMRLRSATAQD